MKRILLTGGSGFIGRNIQESRLSGEYEILAPRHAELDVSDDASVEAYFRRERIDLVIHAATKPGHRNAKDPTNLFYTNTRMFFNLARFSDSYERMIVLGSGAIYDARAYRHAMREEEWKDRIPADEHGFSKYVCETSVEGSRNIVDLRLFGIFGKYEDYAIRFISNMICKAMFDLPLTMKQDRLFDYLFVDDLVPILEHFLERDPPYRSYNATPGKPVALSELARLVLEVMGKDLPIRIALPGMGSEYSADSSRLREEMPGLRFTETRAAIEALADWYESVRDSLDPALLVEDK